MRVINATSTPTIDASVPVLGPVDADVGLVQLGSAFSYIGASQQLLRIAARVLTNGEIITWPSPCGTNCSYSVSFIGPAYQCVPVDDSSTSVPNLNSTSPNWPPPLDPIVYYYAMDPAVNGNATNITAEQGLWFVFTNGSFIHCSLYNATYTTHVNYTNNLPVVETNITHHQQITDDVENDYDNMLPGEAPTGNPKTLWSLLNLYTIHRALETLLIGYITRASALGGVFVTETMIGMSSLVQSQIVEFIYADDFSQKIEDTLVNLTLSLTVFLQQPPINSIEGSNATSAAIYTPAKAMLLTYPARYLYTSYVLWGVYSAALACSAVSICIGYYMLFNNGVAADMSFSQVLVTTRNRLIYVRLRDTNHFRFSVYPLEPSPYPLNRRHDS